MSQVQVHAPPGVIITKALIMPMDDGSIACSVTECEFFFSWAVTAAFNDEEMEPNLIVEINEA
jgi:hypothetical protein